MRRFEYVEGTSSKFWTVWCEGNDFFTQFGKIGSAGQKKLKSFSSPAQAEVEMAKKIAEKVREGYTEVGGAPAAAPPPAPAGPAPIAPLPARPTVASPAKADMERARTALRALVGAVGKRSFVVERRAKDARRALAAVRGLDPSRDRELASLEKSLAEAVLKPKGPLPLGLAIGLLGRLSVASFSRCLTLWTSPASLGTSRFAAALGLLGAERERFGNDELVLGLAAYLYDPHPAPGTRARAFAAIEPHLAGVLAAQGSPAATVAAWRAQASAKDPGALAFRAARSPVAK